MSTVPYQNEIVSAANTAGIPPSVLAGVLDQESGFNATARNVNTQNGQPTSVDQGIAQINNKAHPDVSTSQANDPYYAIPYAANLLSNYYQQTGSWSGALQKYNSGSPTGDSGYANSVLSKANNYTSLDTANSSTTTSASSSSNPLSWLGINFSQIQSSAVKYGLLAIVVVFGFIFIMNGIGG